MIEEKVYIISSQFLKDVTDNDPFKQLFIADHRVDNLLEEKGGRINYTITHVFPLLSSSAGYNFQLIDISNKNIIFGFTSGDTTSLVRKRMWTRYGFPVDYDLKNYKSLKIKGNLGLNRISVRIRKTITWDL